MDVTAVDDDDDDDDDKDSFVNESVCSNLTLSNLTISLPASFTPITLIIINLNKSLNNRRKKIEREINE